MSLTGYWIVTLIRFFSDDLIWFIFTLFFLFFFFSFLLSFFLFAFFFTLTHLQLKLLSHGQSWEDSLGKRSY